MCWTWDKVKEYREERSTTMNREPYGPRWSKTKYNIVIHREKAEFFGYTKMIKKRKNHNLLGSSGCWKKIHNLNQLGNELVYLVTNHTTK